MARAAGSDPCARRRAAEGCHYSRRRRLSTLTRRVEALILDVRVQLDRLLQQKVANPALEMNTAGKGVLEAVSALITSPPPSVTPPPPPRRGA